MSKTDPACAGLLDIFEGAGLLKSADDKVVPPLHHSQDVDGGRAGGDSGEHTVSAATAVVTV